jgi:hypothetical protein
MFVTVKNEFSGFKKGLVGQVDACSSAAAWRKGRRKAIVAVQTMTKLKDSLKQTKK